MQMFLLSGKKLCAAAGGSMIACALVAATVGVSQARAGGVEQFCGGRIGKQRICHGPYVGNGAGIYALLGEESEKGEALCATVQGWNGHYYNVYPWSCARGQVFYEFPITPGFASLSNPNSNTIRPIGDFFWK